MKNEIKQQSSNEYGLSQELLVLSELVNYGVVSIPYGNSGRYDCILDIEGDLYKIQIKSVNKTSEDTISIPFANSRMSANGPVCKSYTEEEIDFICIIYNGQLYFFPPELAKKALTVRISSDNLSHNSNLLDDFRVEKILDIKLKNWVQLKEETRISNGMNQKEPKYHCLTCGTLIATKDSNCISCSRIISRKVERPDRETLKLLIREQSFLNIGKKFQVSDNAIRKWCTAYGLPSKKREISKISEKEWNDI